MLNFTVGPVATEEIISSIGGEQVPYFRTPEFSSIMLQNEELMLRFSYAPERARAVFITGSGTASMEAVIINTLSCNDKAIVVNGGSFGQRFADLLKIHAVPFSEIKLKTGEALKREMLEEYANQGYTALLVNAHETSTGVLYDLNMIGEFCKENGLFFIVDAISSFIADEFNMKAFGADVMITGSQKALACPPGVSIIVLSPEAIKRVNAIDPHSMYFDLKAALNNQNRGQTPFTPAVGILRQINARLRQINNNGGVETETKKIAELAVYFREQIAELPFEMISESKSNAVTALHPLTASAKEIFNVLKDEYGIWVCPNGGELSEKVFRVGHIGALSNKDYDTLIDSLKDMQSRGII